MCDKILRFTWHLTGQPFHGNLLVISTHALTDCRFDELQDELINSVWKSKCSDTAVPSDERTSQQHKLIYVAKDANVKCMALPPPNRSQKLPLESAILTSSNAEQLGHITGDALGSKRRLQP